MICEINSMEIASVVGGSAGRSGRPSVINLQQVFTPVFTRRQPAVRSGIPSGQFCETREKPVETTTVADVFSTNAKAEKVAKIDPLVGIQTVRCFAFLPRFCRACPKLDRDVRAVSPSTPVLVAGVFFRGDLA